MDADGEVDDHAIAMVVMGLMPDDVTLDQNLFLVPVDDARGQAEASHEALIAGRELPPRHLGDGLAGVYAFLGESMRPEDVSRIREEEDAVLRSASRRAAALFAEAARAGGADESRRLSAPAGRLGGGDQERLIFSGSGGGGSWGGGGGSGGGGVLFPFLAASAAAVAGLEKAKYGGDHGGASADCTCCAICIQDYEAGDEQSVMPCAGRHRFHERCLGQWLARSRLCPLCRHALPEEKINVDKPPAMHQALAV